MRNITNPNVVCVAAGNLTRRRWEDERLTCHVSISSDRALWERRRSFYRLPQDSLLFAPAQLHDGFLSSMVAHKKWFMLR